MEIGGGGGVGNEKSSKMTNSDFKSRLEDHLSLYPAHGYTCTNWFQASL